MGGKDVNVHHPAATAALSARFEEALVYATRLHAGQVRKGSGVPYVSHLLAVAALVLEQGGDEEQAIAALLHDAVEDQGGRAVLWEIQTRFGTGVAEIVAACTDAWESPSRRLSNSRPTGVFQQPAKPPWRQRKEAYLAHLPDASDGARLVSAADKVHNARAIVAGCAREGQAFWSRFNAGKEEILWYYGELARIFTERGPAFLAGELRELVAAIRRLGGAPGKRG